MALGAGLLALAFVAVGCDSEDLGDASPQAPSITDITGEIDALSTLDGALDQAGLKDDLSGSGPFTVFMPLNSAFDQIETRELTLPRNEALLTEVLTYHVIPQEIKFRESGGLGAGTTQTFQTLEGDSVTVSVTEGAITVNGVAVSNADVDASNGVAHVVDGVLLETTDAVDRAALAPQFSILRRLIDEAGLESPLRGSGPDDSEGLTVFAPTNDALLAALDGDDSGRIEDDELPSNLADILQHHVLDSVFFASDVPTTETDVQTLEGSDVTVVRDGESGAVTINPGASDEASVAAPNVRVENGVIHGINAVLFPSTPG